MGTRTLRSLFIAAGLGVAMAGVSIAILDYQYMSENVLALIVGGAMAMSTLFFRKVMVQQYEEWVVWGGAILILLLPLALPRDGGTSMLFGTDFGSTTFFGFLATMLALWAGRVWSGHRGISWGVGLIIMVPTLCVLWWPQYVPYVGLERHVGSGGKIVPSLALTYSLLTSSLASDPAAALLGVGPGRFDEVWRLYRPLEVNITPLWDQEPSRGYNYFLTGAIEYGLLWLIAVLLCYSLLFFYVFALCRWKNAIALSGILTGSALLLSSDVPSTYVMVLLMFLVGLCWGEIAARKADVPMTSLTPLLVGIGGSAVLIVGLLVSLALYREADVAQPFINGNVTLVESTAFLEKHPLQQQGLVLPLRARLTLMEYVREKVLEQGTFSNEEILVLQENVRQSLEYIQTLTGMDGRTNVALQGAELRVLMARVSKNAERPVAALVADMQREVGRNRIDPRPSYYLALGYVLQGNLAEAQRWAQLTLRLKPDYGLANTLLGDIQQLLALEGATGTLPRAAD